MKRVLIATALFLMMSAIALSAHAGFRALTEEISMNGDLDRVRVPFMGLGRIFVKITQPDGVRDLRLAVFEKRPGAATVDLDDLVRRHVDMDQWNRMIRTSSKGDHAHIFFQERGEHVGLFIAASDGREVVIIELELDAERFAREMEGDGDFLSLGRRE